MEAKMSEIDVKFIASGRGKARCPSDSAHPDGIDIDATNGEEGVWVDLPYPAPECGVFVITGSDIGNVVITVAGRPDDPRRVKVKKS